MKFSSDQKVLLWEAALWAVFNACTVTYLVAFALELGASNTLIGFLGSIPFLTLIIAEFPAGMLVDFFSRIKIALFASLFGRLFWILILLSPIFFAEPLFWIVVFYFLSYSVSNFASPAFWSMVGDIVPKFVRGRFLSVRMRVLGFVGMIFSALAGIFLKLFPEGDLSGFFVLFAFGVVAGVLGSFQFCRIKSVSSHVFVRHSFRDFFHVSSSLKRFIWVIIFFNFSFMIASPLFAVYMLKNLGMNYAFYGIVNGVSSLTGIAFAKHFGSIIDRLGSRNVAVLCIFGTAFTPFLFLFLTSSSVFWVFPIMVLNGFFWMGADLGVLNLLLDFTDSDKRALQVASYQFFTSIPLIIAPILGGIIADNVFFVLSGIPLVFAISFVLRALSSLFVMFLPEVHSKKEYSLGIVFHEMLAPLRLKKKK